MKKGQFYVDKRSGGWGSYTMGLLAPSKDLNEKSFGMFGAGKSCIKGTQEPAACAELYPTEKAAALAG